MFELGLTYRRKQHIYTKERMQGGVCSGDKGGVVRVRNWATMGISQ